MMLVRSVIALVLSAFFPLLSAGQQTVSHLERLNELYEDFRYKEVIRLGEQFLNQDQPIAINEKCEVHRLLALSYYTQQDMQGALKNFSAIIKLDPDYRLDPRENSPKILAFFEEIRRQFPVSDQTLKTQVKDSLRVTSTHMSIDSLEHAAYLRMAWSIILPGSGQIRSGEKIKGWLLLGGSVALLGTTIYYSLETNRLEDRYRQEIDPDKIAAAYDDYNVVYRKRNLSLAGFLILWLYTQVDYIFLSSATNQSPPISWYPTMDRTGQTKLNLVFTF